jgi:hypothetical protein
MASTQLSEDTDECKAWILSRFPVGSGVASAVGSLHTLGFETTDVIQNDSGTATIWLALRRPKAFGVANQWRVVIECRADVIVDIGIAHDYIGL